MKVVALAISLGMFYWEPGQNTTDTVCLAGNIAIAVINVFWIMFDVKDSVCSAADSTALRQISWILPSRCSFQPFGCSVCEEKYVETV